METEVGPEMKHQPSMMKEPNQDIKQIIEFERQPTSKEAHPYQFDT